MDPKRRLRSIDLVYDPDCPNVAAARSNLARALEQLGIAPHWQEHRVGDPLAPTRTRGFGSPTVLVDGRDVAGGERDAEACCRIYIAQTGSSGAPSVEMIVSAIATALPHAGAADR